MNKSTKILLALLAIATIGYYLISKQPWRTANRKADDFAIKDTNLVTKIFMVNKRAERVLLQRETNNSWTVNGKYLVDEQKIKLLLSTLHDMEIQHPVSPSMHNTAISILASRGIKTEVYEGDELVKIIYIGSETPDQTGTFMMLEGDDDAYAIHIPGFIGYLTPRFFLTEIKWRSKLVFNYAPNEISQLQIDYVKTPKESFTYLLDMYNTNPYLLDSKGEPFLADTQQVKLLLHSFSQKYVEGFYDDSTFTIDERDSLYKRKAYGSIRLKDNKGKETYLLLFEKPIGDKTKDRYDENGNELEIDPEKFFVRISGIDQIASVQEYVFRSILIKKSTLALKNVGEPFIKH
ncbi:MAG: DUF4340 domain-containing protein [bacterium]|nr:DUF4340 domain-containing protein [bacterium]